ncbi:Shedu anti-phage system protein SduA domain-containing protein [Streptomyces sp. NPDC046994]|uniref:Shedu anti-phage system protein SduA domain-containing protein n=1 Tax=Streptomyces sp. NPDC046994 TaxID=3155735 RepID=UPI003454183C
MAAAEWETVATRLRQKWLGPSDEQSRLAGLLATDLGEDVPAPVAAALLRAWLRKPLELPRAQEATDKEIELLRAIAAETGVAFPVGVRERDLLDSWLEAMKAKRAAEFLEKWTPARGDVVVIGKSGKERSYVISSIGASGQLYFRGGRGQRAWPHEIGRIIRISDSDYAAAAYQAQQEAAIRRSTPEFIGGAQLTALEKWKVQDDPSLAAQMALVAALEKADGSDRQRHERPMQIVLEQHPEILAHLMRGNHGTYVRPQVQVGTQYIADFFIGSQTSLGMRWLLVELERPTAELTLQDGRQASETLRKAIQQIRDWREWLANNLDNAQKSADQGGLGLPGIRTRPPGLIIIGREDGAGGNGVMRSQYAETEDIQIRTYDWLLRAARSRYPMRQGALDMELEEDWGYDLPDFPF